MNVFAALTQSIYRALIERPWTTTAGEIDAAWRESQEDCSDESNAKLVARSRHYWRQRRARISIVMGTIASCGILAFIFWTHLDVGRTGVESLENTAPPNGRLSPRGVEVPLISSPAIGLLNGMATLEDNDYYPPVRSGLGLMAERSYVDGPRSLEAYRSSLAAFIDVAMPENLQPILHSSLIRYTENGDPKFYLKNEYNRLLGIGEDPRTKRIWQMNLSPDYAVSEQAASWKDNGEGWEWKLLDETGGTIFVGEHLKDSRLKDVWNLIPNGWRRADMLRYVTLLLHGGIFLDTDTKRINPISAWDNGTFLWQEGRGWLHDNEEKVRRGDSGDERHDASQVDELGPPSLIVGIAVDVDDREDWQKFARQPLQFAEWTIASTPYHPVMLDAIRYMTHHAVKSTEERFRRLYIVQWLLARGEKDVAKQIGQEDRKDPQIWRGASSFTDAVLRYLRLKYDLHWTDLRNLTAPLRVGDVLILPVTSFSPEADLFGGKGVSDPQAMVEHTSGVGKVNTS